MSAYFETVEDALFSNRYSTKANFGVARLARIQRGLGCSLRYRRLIGGICMLVDVPHVVVLSRRCCRKTSAPIIYEIRMCRRIRSKNSKVFLSPLGLQFPLRCRISRRGLRITLNRGYAIPQRGIGNSNGYARDDSLALGASWAMSTIVALLRCRRFTDSLDVLGRAWHCRFHVSR